MENKTGVFIATQSGLFIYDYNNDTIFDFKEFGYRDSSLILPSSQTSFSAISQYRSNVYFSSRESILKLNTSNRKWTSSVNSVIYQGQEVVDFDVFKNEFFIATADMLIHFDKKNNLPEYFNYNFLSNINKLKVNSRKLWIGTSEGIVSYRY